MRALKNLAGQTLIYGLGTIIPRLLNYLLLTPFYTRIFIEDQYGVISELYAYAAFLFVLLTYGMETTYFRFAENEKHPSRIFSTSLSALFLTSSGFIILISIFADPVSHLIKYPEHPEYIILMASIIGIDAFLSIPFANLRFRNKSLRFAAIRIISVVANILFNFFFLVFCPAYLDNNPDSFISILYNPDIGVGYAFISNFLASLITLILLLPDIFKIRFSFDPSLLRRMLVYSLPLMIVGLAGMINEVSDKIMFRFLLHVPAHIQNPEAYSLAQLGIYSANFKLAVLMTIFIQMFRYAAEPFFFSQAKQKDAKELYASVMKYFIIFCLLIFLLVNLYIDLFKYFIGREYRTGLHIVPVVLSANLLLGILFNLSIWYKLTDRTRFGALIALSGSIVTIGLNLLLVPVFGYSGAAWTHFFCNLTMVAISYVLCRKFYPIPYDLKHIFLYIGLAYSLFFISISIHYPEIHLKYIFNTILFFAFAGIVFASERKNFIAKYL